MLGRRGRARGRSAPLRAPPLAQPVRFAVVGVLNSTIDAGTLNLLVWRWPTHSPNQLLAYNSVAFCVGALNSFCLNKYWTFGQKRRVSADELTRFVLLTILGIFSNDSLIWLAAWWLRPLVTNPSLWANLSKGCAVIGTAVISYFGMRLWVFTSHPGRMVGGERG